MNTICPLYQDPFYSYSIDLSGETYVLTFRYSSRSQGYLMDIEDAEENSIIRGIKLVPAYPLTEQYSLENPVGEFYLIPVEETNLANSAVPDPRRVDQTHVLYYTDEL